MSDMTKSRDLIKRYSIARIPFIAINTIEPGRVLGVFKDLAYDVQQSFYIFESTKGIYDISTNNILDDGRSVYDALEFMTEQMKRKSNLNIIFAETPDISEENSDAKRLLALVNLANESNGSVIVLTDHSVWSRLQRLGMAVTVDPPNETEMYPIIKDYIEDYRNSILVEWDESDIREAASALAGITKVEAENIVATLIAGGSIKKTDMEEVRFIKERLFSDISGLERISTDEGSGSIGGLEGLRNWLKEKELLFSAEKRRELRERSLSVPRGILLVGVPGCGKSLSAKFISVSWKLPLYRLDFGTVQGSYVGQSEHQLKEALTLAENVSPCILWIDEIEKGLAGASEMGNSVSVRLVGQFLFWLQECRKPVFVVATANNITMLPPELLRKGRFDELFFVDLPAADERAEILRLYMEKYLYLDFSGPLAEQIVELTDGFTGADLEAVVRNLAYQSVANRNFVLNREKIFRTFEQVYPLSKTSPEKIEAIRQWGAQHALPASGKPIE